MARWSPKYVLVALLAVLLTAGFSVSAAQASVMSAKMTMMTGSGMTVPTDVGIAKKSDIATNGDCKACLKNSGDNGNQVNCPPVCVAPVLAVLPQGLPMTMVPLVSQPSALPEPFLHGRNSLPDPFPPRPSALV